MTEWVRLTEISGDSSRPTGKEIDVRVSTISAFWPAWTYGNKRAGSFVRTVGFAVPWAVAETPDQLRALLGIKA